MHSTIVTCFVNFTLGKFSSLQFKNKNKQKETLLILNMQSFNLSDQILFNLWNLKYLPIKGCC